MSRFLKLIVSLVLIVFILAGIGLIVPQFLGVDVVVVQENNAGNQKVGTAVYTQKKDVAVLAEGDKLLDLGTNTVNGYEVVSYDSSTGVVNVTGGTLDSLLVSRTWLKVIAAVPFIGYLSIATQSTEGLIFLGVLLGVIILLFIFSEILRKGDDDDYYEEEDDDFYSELAERKRRADLDEYEEPHKKKARKARKKSRKADRDGESQAVEEAAVHSFREEAGDVPEEDFRQVQENFNDAGAGDDAGEGMTEIRQDESGEEEDSRPDTGSSLGFGGEFNTDSIPDVQAALEAALENQPLNRSEDTHIPEPAEPEAEIPDEETEIELAIPVQTAEEILQQAYAGGQDPKIRQEEVTGVTLIDFSDAL